MDPSSVQTLALHGSGCLESVIFPNIIKTLQKRG